MAPKKKPGLAEKIKNLIAPRAWPLNHPHVNQHYREGKGGLLYFFVGGIVGRKDASRVTAQSVSRWMPHNGKREMERRLRQLNKAAVKKREGYRGTA